MKKINCIPTGTYNKIKEILETHLVLLDVAPDLADNIVTIGESNQYDFRRMERLVERALFSSKEIDVADDEEEEGL